MAICPGRGEWGLEWLSEVFKKAGIRTVMMDAREHDRLMGLVQGVNHFSTLALALALSESGFGFEDLLQCATPAFRTRLDRIRAMMIQPPGLFESLMLDNPYASECIKQFCQAAENMAQTIIGNNRKPLRQIMERISGHCCETH